MVHAKMFLSLGTTALLAVVPTVTAIGCFDDGGVFKSMNRANFKFGHLHSDPVTFADHSTTDITKELYEQFDSTCNKVRGAIVKPGSKWSDCTQWATMDVDSGCTYDCKYKNSDCYLNKSYEEQQKCIGDCQNACPLVPQGSSGNHIDWTISHDGEGSETRTLDFEVCKEGFKQAYERCKDYGGEVKGGGFIFRLDPNCLNCGETPGF